MMVEVVADLADSHVCCCCATGTAKLCQPRKKVWLRRRCSMPPRLQTRKAILEPPSFRLAFCRCGPRDDDATWVPPPRHGWVIWDADEAAHQAVSSHPLYLPQSIQRASRPDHERPQPFCKGDRPASFGHGTQRLLHQLSPGARSRFVAIVRTQSHFYRRRSFHRPRDRHRHFFLALTRTGPLSIYPCPPAFRQTGNA